MSEKEFQNELKSFILENKAFLNYLEDKWTIFLVSSCDFNQDKLEDDDYLTSFLKDKRL